MDSLAASGNEYVQFRATRGAAVKPTAIATGTTNSDTEFWKRPRTSYPVPLFGTSSNPIRARPAWEAKDRREYRYRRKDPRYDWKIASPYSASPRA